MTTAQISFNPNNTLFMNNSLFFQKSTKSRHSRNNSKVTKKPQLSKLSMITKTSAYSNKGTYNAYLNLTHKPKSKGCNKNKSGTFNLLCQSLDGNNKQNQVNNNLSSPNKSQSLHKYENMRDKTLSRKRAYQNSSLQMQKRTKRSTRCHSNSIKHRDSKNSQIKYRNKSKQKKSLNNLNSQICSKKIKNKKKSTIQVNRLCNPDLSIQSYGKKEDLYSKIPIKNQFKSFADQCNTASVESKCIDNFGFHSHKNHPYMPILFRTNKKRSAIDQENAYRLSNQPLYCSALLNKSPLIIQDYNQLDYKPFQANDHQKYYFDHAQSKCFIDQKNHWKQQPEKQCTNQDKQQDNSQIYEKVFKKTQKILNQYKDECSRLRKQRDRYRNRYRKTMNQLKNHSFISNNGMPKNNVLSNKSKSNH